MSSAGEPKSARRCGCACGCGKPPVGVYCSNCYEGCVRESCPHCDGKRAPTGGGRSVFMHTGACPAVITWIKGESFFRKGAGVRQSAGAPIDSARPVPECKNPDGCWLGCSHGEGDDSADRNTVVQALAEAHRFFEARDRMNARIHLTEPRWSPITVLVRDAWWLVVKPPESAEGPARFVQDEFGVLRRPEGVSCDCWHAANRGEAGETLKHPSGYDCERCGNTGVARQRSAKASAPIDVDPGPRGGESAS